MRRESRVNLDTARNSWLTSFCNPLASHASRQRSQGSNRDDSGVRAAAFARSFDPVRIPALREIGGRPGVRLESVIRNLSSGIARRGGVRRRADAEPPPACRALITCPHPTLPAIGPRKGA
ncbi:hypothetical protein SKAU_G00363440 [Synaphobranchus kaupii]|uniref:Uncharacterized protein n=1 Tax=Synaphobranchus kaupii TaxID=118154 RepID=A0A9Q1EIV3_SYNKA|nr:hypothetical protein SKAU_G00363440 [Synaphobranchus kaupii]